MYRVPSKREIDESMPEFSLLPQDDYRLVITEVKEDREQKFQPKKKKNGEPEETMEDVVNITFEILSLKDGSPAGDIEGKSAAGRKVWFKARPNSVGFMTDGTPAKTRCLIAFLTDSDIFEELNYNSWNDFMEEEINAEIIIYVNQKGVKRNKIGRFLPNKKVVIAPRDTGDIPVIEETKDGHYKGELRGVTPSVQARRTEGVKFPKENSEKEINVGDIPF